MHFVATLSGYTKNNDKKKKKMLMRYHHEFTIYNIKTSLYWLKYMPNALFSEKRKLYNLEENKKSYHGLEMS